MCNCDAVRWHKLSRSRSRSRGSGARRVLSAGILLVPSRRDAMNEFYIRAKPSASRRRRQLRSQIHHAKYRPRTRTVRDRIPISKIPRHRTTIDRGATTFSKLGVQCLGVGYCTEQNADGIPSFMHYSLLRNGNHTIHEKVGVIRPNFFFGGGGVRNPLTPSDCALDNWRVYDDNIARATGH